MPSLRFITGFFERYTYHRLLNYRLSAQFVKDELRRSGEGKAPEESELRAAHVLLRASVRLTRGIERSYSLQPRAESLLIQETIALTGAFIPVSGVSGVPLKAALSATICAENWASSDLSGEEKASPRATSEYRQLLLAGQEKKAFARFVSRAKTAFAGTSLTEAERESLIDAALCDAKALERIARCAVAALEKKNP
ncbi:hypothetical protein MAF45_00890 [Mesosutterella sp. OilRF-GAM-744-9]|uniref:Uncharacterized protein n=1 Tax=Mesosutterella porci TaxID=2915351 RepID=A0ABS9MN19_9BURK|nr:hypothetical protein [Mesosutterella sp. oilRF-744-WT-GAM-9]MCG5030013.1 hypothetical protein [Mesosutterella sp. oilRF-744-WT-GAM-9]MCI6531257.1 hypothetical protein [Mesosutterella sp.]